MSDQFEPAPQPINEFARAMRAKATGLMDAEPSVHFEHFASWARESAGCIGAYISLIDDTQEKVLGVDLDGMKECKNFDTERTRSLAQYALLSYQPKIVPDLREHPVLKSHPMVKDPNSWVFWAAFPLITKDGLVLGALTVVDHKAHQMSEEKIDELRLIAGNVSDLIHTISHEQQPCLRDGMPSSKDAAE